MMIARRRQDGRMALGMLGLLVCFVGFLRPGASFTLQGVSRQERTIQQSTPSPMESSVHPATGEVDATRQRIPSYWLMEPSSSPSKRWKQLCPPLWNPTKTKDASLMWSCCDDTEKVAGELLHRLVDPSGGSSSLLEPSMVETVAGSLEQFRDFCTQHLKASPEENQSHGVTFKAGIVTTRGSSGTKCPQWHVDHVPVRWIQSLAGPGCEFVMGNTQQGIRWDLINGLNAKDDDDADFVVEESVTDRNQALVRDDVAEIYVAREQEAVLLAGNRWNEYAKDATQTLQPVVHKSPTRHWGQERVLLTQDVILDN